MFLKELTLFNFKNHNEGNYRFCEGINCITGNNGVGKTNLADAIYYLANAKSFFNGIDQLLVSHSNDFFTLRGIFEERGGTPAEILVQFQTKVKKTIKKNGKAYPRLLDHIGSIPVVFITPYDIELILGGSEERRRFLDFTICQTDKTYLSDLATYKKILEQRNAILKKFEGRPVEPEIMESFDVRLSASGNRIFEKRKQFVAAFEPLFLSNYQHMGGNEKMPGLTYNSALFESPMLEILQKNSHVDRVVMRTTEGIHKDDIEFTLDTFPLKKYGSQGELKSFVIALKLAQFEYFSRETGETPILLLDDIFEKIDASRAEKLMDRLKDPIFGQIFITDTHAPRVQKHIESLEKESMFVELG